MNICIILLVIFFCVFRIKKVPKGTVYIVDRKSHYLKTVKRGFLLFIPSIDKITSIVSTTPQFQTYQDFFETEDGKVCYISFSVKYSANNIEDVLYNLESVRRSIDDIIKSAMYHAIISLKLSYVTMGSISDEFNRNLRSQASGIGINVSDLVIKDIGKNIPYTNVPTFKSHISSSQSNDPIKY